MTTDATYMADTTDTANTADVFTLPTGAQDARTLPAGAEDTRTLPTEVADARTLPAEVADAHTLPAGTGRGGRPGGIGKHYWTIPHLPIPSGASTALKSFIAMAEAALQTAVDLLGRGTTFPPPRVDDLMTTVVYKNLGEGETTELYQKTLAAVEARQASLLTMDDKVLDVANVMSADKDRTLAAIKHLVADLVAVLNRKTAAKLQPADETALMDTIAKTIEEVYKRVTKVAQDNLSMSGGGSNGGNPGGNPGGGSAGGGGQQQAGASGGGGGGDSGGSGIMQALMMIPMLGASLLPSALQLVEKMNDKNDRHDDRQQDGPPGGAPPPGAAAPNSPGAPPPGAAAPGAPGAPGAPPPGPGGNPAGASVPVSATDTPPGAPPPPPPPPPPPRTGSAGA